jgi:hypothetical protein
MAPAYDGGILVLHASGDGSIPSGATEKKVKINLQTWKF